MPTNKKPNNKKILVVGGAGYIGAHMVFCLNEAGFTPIVLDNFSTGHRDAVIDAECIEGDMMNSALLDKIFSENQIQAVMHFAALIQVGESVQQPAKYYQNNVSATLQLLQSMLKWKVKHFIFSSTAAVYGEPKYTPIDEIHPLQPINPYGQSKRMVEQVLEDFSKAYDFHYTTLRYFNAAGADPKNRISERHEPETHLIPLILQAASGKRKNISVFGRDYPTADGTCVRDYVHVTDLCTAHLLALKALFDGGKNKIYNLGTGFGYSVQQVIDTAKKITKKEIAVIDAERRNGDPAVLVADASLAMQELNWQPEYSDLETIIQHAWASYV
jgi:UDP-glucose 4-epimerase